MQHVGMAPKTMKVTSEDHGGQTVMINADDFNKDVHTPVTPPKPRLKPEAVEEIDAADETKSDDK